MRSNFARDKIILLNFAMLYSKSILCYIAYPKYIFYHANRTTEMSSILLLVENILFLIKPYIYFRNDMEILLKISDKL